jgi:hypothetical protein
LPDICSKDVVPAQGRLRVVKEINRSNHLGILWLLVFARPLGWFVLLVRAAPSSLTRRVDGSLFDEYTRQSLPRATHRISSRRINIADSSRSTGKGTCVAIVTMLLRAAVHIGPMLNANDDHGVGARVESVDDSVGAASR